MSTDSKDFEAGCDLDYIPNVAREVRVKKLLSNSFGFAGTTARWRWGPSKLHAVSATDREAHTMPNGWQRAKLFQHGWYGALRTNTRLMPPLPLP